MCQVLFFSYTLCSGRRQGKYCICTCTCMLTCVYMYMHVHKCMCMCVCVCVCIWLSWDMIALAHDRQLDPVTSSQSREQTAVWLHLTSLTDSLTFETLNIDEFMLTRNIVEMMLSLGRDACIPHFIGVLYIWSLSNCVIQGSCLLTLSAICNLMYLPSFSGGTIYPAGRFVCFDQRYNCWDGAIFVVTRLMLPTPWLWYLTENALPLRLVYKCIFARVCVFIMVDGLTRLNTSSIMTGTKALP